jgi:hypothetical protein
LSIVRLSWHSPTQARLITVGIATRFLYCAKQENEKQKKVGASPTDFLKTKKANETPLLE